MLFFAFHGGVKRKRRVVIGFPGGDVTDFLIGNWLLREVRSLIRLSQAEKTSKDNWDTDDKVESISSTLGCTRDVLTHSSELSCSLMGPLDVLRSPVNLLSDHYIFLYIFSSQKCCLPVFFNSWPVVRSCWPFVDCCPVEQRSVNLISRITVFRFTWTRWIFWIRTLSKSTARRLGDWKKTRQSSCTSLSHRGWE